MFERISFLNPYTVLVTQLQSLIFCRFFLNQGLFRQIVSCIHIHVDLLQDFSCKFSYNVCIDLYHGFYNKTKFALNALVILFPRFQMQCLHSKKLHKKVRQAYNIIYVHRSSLIREKQNFQITSAKSVQLQPRILLLKNLSNL